METPITNAPAGTAPVATPAPAATAPTPAAAPSAPDLKTVMSKLSSAERLIVVTKGIGALVPAEAPAAIAPAAPAATPESTPASTAEVKTEVTPAAESVVVETPSVTPAPGSEESNPAGGEGGEGKGKRFRFSSEDDVAVSQLAKSRGISLVEAARIYAGEPTSTPPPIASAPAAVETAPAEDPAIKTYDTRIATTEQQINELIGKRDAASDDLDAKGANKLNDQIADLKADLRALRNEKQGHLHNVEQQTRDGYQRGVSASSSRVYAEFPQFSVEGSMERWALDAYVDRAIKDPKRQAEFKDTNWPERLAREFATKQGIKPKSAGTAPAAPVVPAQTPAPAAAAVKPAVGVKTTPTQVQPVAGAKLLTGADGREMPSGSRPLTRDELLHRIRTDPEARRQAVREIGKGTGR